MFGTRIIIYWTNLCVCVTLLPGDPVTPVTVMIISNYRHAPRSLLSNTCFFKKFHLYLTNTNRSAKPLYNNLKLMCNIPNTEQQIFKLEITIFHMFAKILHILRYKNHYVQGIIVYIYVTRNAEKRGDFRTTCYRIRSGH